MEGCRGEEYQCRQYGESSGIEMIPWQWMAEKAVEAPEEHVRLLRRQTTY